jgi:hypothetical protein
MKSSGQNWLKKESVVNTSKGFANVDSTQVCSTRILGGVEANSNLCCDWQKSGSARVVRGKPMLGVAFRKSISDDGKEQTLQDFYSWTKERDGPVEPTQISRLPRL